MNKDTKQLSIKELLSSDEEYVIPIYQRNYAWEEGEITQLIQDIIDYLPKDQNYYIGTLVVHQRPNATFETIDGQQRLTTLSLLAAYLKRDKALNIAGCDTISLYFDSREHSRATFAAIFEGRFKNDPAEILAEQQINTGILNGYRLIKKILLPKLEEGGITPQQFADFLFHRVKIMRVKVPSDTDLNHYFEIMNSRGEQLEKSEVLKAQILELLEDPAKPEESKQNQHCLHTVWEACANMERYVQMGFTVSQRAAIFGDKDWGSFKAVNFHQNASIPLSISPIFCCMFCAYKCRKTFLWTIKGCCLLLKNISLTIQML